ncbi:leucine aminopeptidase 2, chloroplastic [Olea europaea subsp. europaea]|uniref:Leucine aminopeptidase 2, chloroplastic n=1 Tax=Olea europaea subsp. europaea TaxID=158383 RepID=A0A8S0UHE8_OLEEU|nr:leucine aminopeptidase 2, chloroplastic [Olea europaea subsp. europaea]
MATISVSSLTLLASTSAAAASSSVFTKLQFGPIRGISLAATSLFSKRTRRMAHSIARATLGLTRPNQIELPMIFVFGMAEDLVCC